MEKAPIRIADREFLSPEEMAAWMGVSLRSLGEWRSEGLKYYRKGKRIFYKKKDIEQFMESY